VKLLLMFVSSLALLAVALAAVSAYGDTWYTAALGGFAGAWGGLCSGLLMFGRRVPGAW
jgi:hypothetical protein